MGARGAQTAHTRQPTLLGTPADAQSDNYLQLALLAGKKRTKYAPESHLHLGLVAAAAAMAAAAAAAVGHGLRGGALAVGGRARGGTLPRPALVALIARAGGVGARLLQPALALAVRLRTQVT